MEIDEAREVRVRQGETTFVFLADHSSGRLVVREEAAGGDEVCAVTVGDRGELEAFLTGLRRVLGVDDGRRDREGSPGRRGEAARERGVAEGAGRALGSRKATDAPASSRAARGASETGRPDDRAGSDGDADEDRDAAIERARQRNPQAFQPWTRAEEQRLAQAYEGGATLAELAREHQRSERAVDMRLQRLGLR